jgi:hypothetical protein
VTLDLAKPANAGIYLVAFYAPDGTAIQRRPVAGLDRALQIADALYRGHGTPAVVGCAAPRREATRGRSTLRFDWAVV